MHRASCGSVPRRGTDVHDSQMTLHALKRAANVPYKIIFYSRHHVLRKKLHRTKYFFMGVSKIRNLFLVIYILKYDV